jgi:hypothetical protein
MLNCISFLLASLFAETREGQVAEKTSQPDLTETNLSCAVHDG